MTAARMLHRAYNGDVAPTLAMARHEGGGAIDPIAACRETDWLKAGARERRATAAGAGVV